MLSKADLAGLIDMDTKCRRFAAGSTLQMGSQGGLQFVHVVLAGAGRCGGAAACQLLVHSARQWHCMCSAGP